MNEEFQRLEDEWVGIVERCDRSAAETFLAEDFVLSSVGGVSSSMSRTDWIGALPQIDTRSLAAEVEDVRRYGEAAVVKARLRWAATMGGRDLSGEYVATDVFRLEEGSWRASWRISVRLPLP